MKIKQWLWHNKEGAIIGGIYGLIGSYLTSGMPPIYQTLGGLKTFILVFIQPFMWTRLPLLLMGGPQGTNFSSNIFSTMNIISIILFIIIGAIIDSLWRKNK